MSLTVVISLLISLGGLIIAFVTFYRTASRISHKDAIQNATKITTLENRIRSLEAVCNAESIQQIKVIQKSMEELSNRVDRLDSDVEKKIDRVDEKVDKILLNISLNK